MTQIALTNNFNSLIGQAEDWTKAQTNFTDITTVVNGQISDDNFSSSAGMYAAYRTIHDTFGSANLDLTANTYFFSYAGVANVNGASVVSTKTKYLAAADFAITGRTAKLRTRAVVASNATAPAINFTFGLAPVAVAGGADLITYSLSAAVVGSTVSINAPLASTATVGTGSDFSVPADGLYVLFMATTGTLANNSFAGIQIELQQRWT